VARIVEGADATVQRSGADPLTSRLTGVRGWGKISIAIAPFGTAYDPWAELPELWTTASDELLVSLASLTAEPLASGSRTRSRST